MDACVSMRLGVDNRGVVLSCLSSVAIDLGEGVGCDWSYYACVWDFDRKYYGVVI